MAADVVTGINSKERERKMTSYRVMTDFFVLFSAHCGNRRPVT